jgi:hypothetical protein
MKTGTGQGNSVVFFASSLLKGQHALPFSSFDLFNPIRVNLSSFYFLPCPLSTTRQRPTIVPLAGFLFTIYSQNISGDLERSRTAVIPHHPVCRPFLTRTSAFQTSTARHLRRSILEGQ